MSGKRFGDLIVTTFSHTDGQSQTFWNCICDCGNHHTVNGNKLRRGEAKSCGCKQYLGRLKHGLCGTRIYTIWSDMKQRVLNPNSDSYPDYGGRGITIYHEWMDVQKFFEYMGQPPDNVMSIDRYPDMNGNYEPGNVRWATPAEQAANKRTNRPITAFGKTMIARDWEPIYSIKHWTITSRINDGWEEEHAVSWPTSKVKYKTRIAAL
jgi:hypothetical protein